MADLPRNDLVTDEVPVHLRQLNDRVPELHSFSSDEKQHNSIMDERVDSGVGYSLGSQECSFSLDKMQAFVNSEDGYQCRQIIENQLPSSQLSDNVPSSLQNQFTNLSISDSDRSKDCVQSNNRCDSGICDSGVCDSGHFAMGESCPVSPIRAAFPECAQTSLALCDSHFSPQEVDELYSQDEDGDTHLHMSIIHLLPEVSLKIISLAPRYHWINVPNTLHQTPLHLAVATRQLLIARRLMAAGAAMYAPDHCGNTPLHIACKEGLTRMVNFLLTPVTYEETLANPFRIPFQRVPQDLSIRNYDGYTCTHLALQGGHLDILMILLSKGANINDHDGKSGRTLLHMAADLGDLPALKLLLQYRGLNLNARTYGGLTPACLAQGRGLSQVVGLLLLAGADCSHLSEDSPGESTDEEMSDCMYDDICINGQLVLRS